MTPPVGGAGARPPSVAGAALPRRWRSGWRRYVFPGIWLVYLAQTVSGVQRYASGWGVVAGYAIVAAFVGCYLVALSAAWSARTRRFWAAYAGMLLLCAAETPFAHEHAFVMLVYIVVVTTGRFGRYAVPMVAAMAATAAFAPALVPSWHAGVEPSWLITVPLVGVAMWGFFGIIRSNVELAAARAEVARLAAENERTRIARDLHDLLGHSLTAITVKAGLARRLAERGEHARSTAEIGEVERLSRRTLADVRAAVAGHRDITLAGELATAREVLRAAGILAELPGSVDVVDPALSELFGWVVREGVTNVVRHSRATHCTVTLGPDRVEITDDGRGGLGSTAAATGLVGLRERVAALGGTVEARPLSPGWRLRVRVPTPLTNVRPDPAPSSAPAPTIGT
jgi:two-component system sensor histidine kinase DesK